MKYFILKKEDIDFKIQAAKLLQGSFKSYEDLKVALEEIDELLEEEKLCIILLLESEVIGLIGGAPSYSGNIWELHPLVIKKNFQYKGYGSHLIKYFENIVKKRGAMTIYLGSDDLYNQTSLYNDDLYDDLWMKIKNIKNINNHPYTFYKKNGYQIVGVIPDANGFGKPDILMAKRVGDINV